MRPAFVWSSVVALALGCLEDNENAIEPDADAAVGADVSVTVDGGRDAPDPDMARTPDPDMAVERPEAACGEACEEVVRCTAALCDPRDPALVTEACLEACAGLGPFAAVAAGSETCEDLVAFAVQSIGGDYAEACEAGGAEPRVEYEECTDFAEHFTECLLEGCPNAAPLSEYLPGSYESFCNDAVNGGQNPQDYANIARLPCDNPALERIVRAQYERDDEDPDAGGLADLCEDGPSPSVEVCADACEALHPCLPEDGDAGARALRETDRCIFTCAGTGFVPDSAWPCAAEAVSCQAVFQCFGDAAAEGCVDYAARIAACTAEACPGTAGVTETLARFLVGTCGDQVEAGALTREQVAAVDAATPCDEPIIASLVTYLTEPGPGDGQGSLARVCEEPANDPELCADACDVFAPCAPDDENLGSLRDRTICAYVCQVEADAPAQIWECIRDAESCPAVLACIPMMDDN